MPTRRDLESAYWAAVEAADPFRAVASVLTYEHGVVGIGGRAVGSYQRDQITVLGIGKAAPRMADAVAEITGSTSGIVVSPYEAPCAVTLVTGGHPIPTQDSLNAGALVRAVTSRASDDGVIIAVISGGGSAAADVLAGSVTLDDLVGLNEVLLASGMPIDAMNEVRSAVSGLKAGGVAQWAAETQVVSLVLSDVVGGAPEFVSSGPTIPSGLGTRARDAVDRWLPDVDLPSSVDAAINDFRREGVSLSVVVETVGSPAIAADAAAARLRSEGFDVRIATTELKGEARDQAVQFVVESEPDVVWVAAGEPTVTVTGSGAGGRSQEAALAAASALARTGGIFAALGTDGIDGPTDAAGAIVDDATIDLATGLGWDIEAELDANNSNPLLADAGCTVVTGPTGTNVCDVWMWSKPSTR